MRQHNLVQPFALFIDRLPRTGGVFGLVTAPLKLVGQSGSLFWTLATQVRPPPELIIVQTPPALPALFIVRLVGMLLGTRVVIDWHNLGYSILAMRFPPQSFFVRAYRLLEKLSGGRAFAHLSVTRALKQHLEDTWHFRGPIKVLYDRPPTHFRRATVLEAHRLLSPMVPRLSPSLATWIPRLEAGEGWSPFTREEASGRIELRADRPALVVSSTSWTPDEDFGMLLRAASLYEKRAREVNNASEQGALSLQSSYNTPVLSSESPQVAAWNSPVVGAGDDTKRMSLGLGEFGSRRHKSRRASFTPDELPRAKRLPKMLLVVTGKGEQRDYYIREIERMEREEAWQYVRIRTAWLQSDEYPVLLGSADVGVSLHSSSSGMDLPMKVVDMLGCGLTVCALGFPCIGELVKHGSNGLVFYSEKELAIQLESLLARFPAPSWLATRAAQMKTLFPEDMTASPPLSSPNSPTTAFTPDTSARASPSANSVPGLTQRPSSPMPTFTLLQSPAFSSEPQIVPSLDNDDYGAMDDHGGGRTWGHNWKRVLRPLLAEADEAEAAEERRAKFAHVASRQKHGPNRAQTTSSRWGRTVGGQSAFYGAVATPKSRSSYDGKEGDRGYAGLALLDEKGVYLDTMGNSSSTIFTRRHRRGTATSWGPGDSRIGAMPDGAEGGEGTMEMDNDDPRAIGHLRQRTNKDSIYWGRRFDGLAMHEGGAHGNGDTSIDSSIPGIHISAPPT